MLIRFSISNWFILSFLLSKSHTNLFIPLTIVYTVYCITYKKVQNAILALMWYVCRPFWNKNWGILCVECTLVKCSRLVRCWGEMTQERDLLATMSVSQERVRPDSYTKNLPFWLSYGCRQKWTRIDFSIVTDFKKKPNGSGTNGSSYIRSCLMHLFLCRKSADLLKQGFTSHF